MGFGSAAEKSPVLSETQEVTRQTSDVLGRKIWLPKLLYSALPYFYLVSGLGALIATLYIGNWTWILPHYLLFAAACLHMGVLIYRRRKDTGDPRD